jgi:hypothetical protein
MKSQSEDSVSELTCLHLISPNVNEMVPSDAQTVSVASRHDHVKLVSLRFAATFLLPAGPQRHACLYTMISCIGTDNVLWVLPANCSLTASTKDRRTCAIVHSYRLDLRAHFGLTVNQEAVEAPLFQREK